MFSAWRQQLLRLCRLHGLFGLLGRGDDNHFVMLSAQGEDVFPIPGTKRIKYLEVRCEKSMFMSCSCTSVWEQCS